MCINIFLNYIIKPIDRGNMVYQWKRCQVIIFQRGRIWLDEIVLLIHASLQVAHALPHPIVEDCYFNFLLFYMNFQSYLMPILHQNLLVYLLSAFIAANAAPDKHVPQNPLSSYFSSFHSPCISHCFMWKIFNILYIFFSQKFIDVHSI